MPFVNQYRTIAERERELRAELDNAALDATARSTEMRERQQGGMTAKQRSFLESLIAERVGDNQERDKLTAELERLNVAQASGLIGQLLTRPKNPVRTSGIAKPMWPNVPAGRYALREQDGVVKFYRVGRPTEGRWAGFIFLDAQASDDFWPIKTPDAKRLILGAIAQDPKAASALYGKELGVCGVCGRTLTDEESRAAGIGPICAGKEGWA